MATGSARRWRTNRRFDYFAGTHDGYHPVAHCRHVLMMHGDMLIVADCVVAAPEPTESKQDGHRKAMIGRSTDPVRSAAVHWHFDPSWVVDLQENGALLRGTHETLELAVAGGVLAHFRGDDATGLGWHAPVYGRVEPTSTIRIAARGESPQWVVSVFGLDPSNRIHHVAVTPVHGSGDSLHYAAAIRIERATSIDHVVVAEAVDDRRQALWRSQDVVSDARMLFWREVHSSLTAMAMVDVTTVRSDRHRPLERAYPSPVTDLYLTIDDGAPLPAEAQVTTGREECAELLDSLTARQ
jgi:hypothetical protein